MNNWWSEDLTRQQIYTAHNQNKRIRCTQIYNALLALFSASKKAGDSPIPMTVPYSAFLFPFPSSAVTETGHKQMRARNAMTRRESEDAMRRDCVRVGRRGRRDMAVMVVCWKVAKVSLFLII